VRGIPRLDKRTLRPVRSLLGADLADAHLGTVLCKDDVLLLHLAHAALGELVRVHVDLGPCQRCIAGERARARAVETGTERKGKAYLIQHPPDTAENQRQNHQWHEVERAHVCTSRRSLAWFAGSCSRSQQFARTDDPTCATTLGSTGTVGNGMDRLSLRLDNHERRAQCNKAAAAEGEKGAARVAGQGR
jgi:hypothetical protein